METAQAVRQFLASREHCSQASRTWYYQMLSPLSQHFAGTQFENITLDGLREYLKKRREGNTARGGPRAGASLNSERKAIRALFNYGQREGWRADNPAKAIQPIRTDHRREPLSHDETCDILEYLVKAKGKWALRNLALFVLFLDSSARREEVHCLTVEDVNLREGTARLIGKGDKTRTVSLSPLTCDVLRQYLAGRYKGPLFITSRGTALSAVGIRKVFDSISAATGVNLYPHKVRRTSAVMSYLSGMDINALRRHMGHSNIATTAGYIEAAERQRAQAEHREHSPVMDARIRGIITNEVNARRLVLVK